MIGSVHGSSAWRTDAAALAVPAAAIFVTLIFLHWSLDFDVSQLGLPSGPAPDSLWKPEHYRFGTPLTLGAAFALLFGALGFLAQGPGERPLVSALWAGSAVAAPIATGSRAICCAAMPTTYRRAS